MLQLYLFSGWMSDTNVVVLLVVEEDEESISAAGWGLFVLCIIMRSMRTGRYRMLPRKHFLALGMSVVL